MVRGIADALSRQGHEGCVLTSWRGRPFEGGQKTINKVEVVYLRSLAEYRALTINPGVRAFCRDSLAKFDIVHIYGLYDLLGPAVAHYAESRKIPYVVELMGMLRPIDRSLHLKRAWHWMYGDRLLRNAAAVIASSHAEQREACSAVVIGERAALRYNGIDLDDFARLPPPGLFRHKWRIPAHEPVVLFLGRLIPRKGADMLIRAFAEACPARGRLVIAGPEGERHYLSKLQEIARLSGVGTRTLFTGLLREEQKKAALIDCNVFALASRYENFANSVVEAIACGKPVIVTENCGVSELVANRVGLVIPRETGALVQALGQLLGNRSLYERLQSGCPQVAASLSWNGLIKRQQEIYCKALSNEYRHRAGAS
jgi:glycosyltransferase involved in cell wall biosynthesis